MANQDSDTVSVINATTNTVIGNIPVGEGPSSVAINGEVAYVANHLSNTVSVVDTKTNEVVAGITFNLLPFRGGQIVCNGLSAPINSYFYVSSGTKCIAKPIKGFEFSSWTQNLAENSTITVSASSGSAWTQFLDIFGVKLDDPAATLTVNRFGSFTAYFRALPPPFPPEYWTSLFTIVVTALFTIVVTALVGSLLIPAVVGWLSQI